LIFVFVPPRASTVSRPSLTCTVPVPVAKRFELVGVKAAIIGTPSTLT
jgi:hypothetical protein